MPTHVHAAEPQAETAPLLEKAASIARQFSPAPEQNRSALSDAIDEVTQVVESLKQVLDQMEGVLETVELAERQKTGDEREIESLRRALRQLQRPRGTQARNDEAPATRHEPD